MAEPEALVVGDRVRLRDGYEDHSTRGLKAGDVGEVMAVRIIGRVGLVDLRMDRDLGYFPPILCSDVDLLPPNE
jgi:hypothetical protein